MEIFFILALIGGFLALALISGIKRKWFNMAFWIYTGVGLGAFEIISKIATGHTISQNHWIITTNSPVIGWIAAVCSALLLGGVWLHLAWKSWFDKRYGEGKDGNN